MIVMINALISFLIRSGSPLNNPDFSNQRVQQFFDHDYHDRGMVKWQGLYLSDHTAALH